MKNIAYQSSLFQIRRGTNHKEYRDLCERLDFIDRIFSTSGVEFEFAEYYLERIVQTSGNPELKLTPKEIRRHTVYAVQALRSNYLRLELKSSFRQAAFLIAASEDFQRFIFAGDFASAKCPGKSKLHDFALLVPDDFIRRINESLLREFSSDAAGKYGCSPLENKTLWLDATCLMSNIHFPVDWVLLRDAVRSLVKAILCIRRHGLKNRIPAPASFLSQINALCMEMSNSRRRQDAEKRRKDVLRRMKKICRTVGNHGKRYRDLLASRRNETGLSEKQAAQILNRLDNVLEKLPSAIEQAHRRIISGEKLEADEKTLSLYDDTASAIVRGKSSAEIEFGNELLIAEQADGFIVDWQLYEDKTADQRKLGDFLESYQPQNKGVETIVTDRGFDGKPNQRKLEKINICNGMCPRSPAQMTERMKDENFQTLQHRRSQTEGRVAAIKRFIGDKMPCRNFEDKKRHAAWAVFSHNLHLLAKLMAEARRQARAA